MGSSGTTKGSDAHEHESKSKERKQGILEYTRIDSKEGRDSMTHNKDQLSPSPTMSTVTWAGTSGMLWVAWSLTG